MTSYIHTIIADTMFQYGIVCIGIATIGFLDANIETEATVLDIYEFDKGIYHVEVSYIDLNNHHRTSLICLSTPILTKTINVKYAIWNMDDITEGCIWTCLVDLVNLFRIGLVCIMFSTVRSQ